MKKSLERLLQPMVIGLHSGRKTYSAVISAVAGGKNKTKKTLADLILAFQWKLIEKGFGSLAVYLIQCGESLLGLPGLDCRTATRLVECGHADLVCESCYRMELDEDFCEMAHALIAKGKGLWVVRLLKTLPEKNRPIGVCVDLCRNGFLEELVGSPNHSLWYPDQMISAAATVKDVEGICSYILQIFTLKRDERIYLSDSTIHLLISLCRSMRGSLSFIKMLSSLKTLLTLISIDPISRRAARELICLDAEMAQIVLLNPRRFRIRDEAEILDAIICAGHRNLFWGLSEDWSQEAKSYASRALIKAGVGDLLGEEHDSSTFERLGGLSLPADVIEHLCLLGHADDLSRRLAHSSNVNADIALVIMKYTNDGPRAVTARLFAVKKDGRGEVALEAYRKGGAKVISSIMAECLDSRAAQLILAEAIQAEDAAAIVNWLVSFPAEDQNKALLWLVENGKTDLVVTMLPRLHDLSAETGLALCKTEYHGHFFPSQSGLFVNLSDDRIVNELIDRGHFSGVDAVFQRLKTPGTNGIPICFDLQKGAEIILQELSRAARNFDGFKDLSNETAERLIQSGAARLVAQHPGSFPGRALKDG